MEINFNCTSSSSGSSGTSPGSDLIYDGLLGQLNYSPLLRHLTTTTTAYMMPLGNKSQELPTFQLPRSISHFSFHRQ